MAETDSKLLALLHNIAKEQKLVDYDIKVKPISSGGANYSSILFVATISSKNKDDLNLFIKVASMGEKFRSVAKLNIFEMEKSIYTELKTYFREFEKRNGVAEKDQLRMSEYYGASSVPYEEMLVLEDLSSRGFESHDRMKSVDWEYATGAVTELAKLHALSIALQQFEPEKYQKIKQFIHTDLFNTQEMDVVFNGSKKLALGAVREENLKKLQNFLDATDMGIFWAYYNSSKREVITHGDFRPSNLMHRRRDDGSVEVIILDYQTLRGGSPVADLMYFIFTGTDAEFRAHYYEKLVDYYYSELRAALTRLGVNPDDVYPRKEFESELREDGSVEVITVDYQTLRLGSPVVDLLYFIFTGTDAEFRALYYEKLLDHYYSELTAALIRLGINPGDVYTREDFEIELREKLPYGLAVAVSTLQIVTVEAEHAPKVDDNLQMSDFSNAKTSSLYPERLNGVVDDFVRWGVL